MCHLLATTNGDDEMRIRRTTKKIQLRQRLQEENASISIIFLKMNPQHSQNSTQQDRLAFKQNSPSSQSLLFPLLPSESGT